MTPEDPLRKAGLALPVTESPAFDDEPLAEHDGIVYLAGHLAKEGGELRARRRVAIEVSEAVASRQMALCALLALARLKGHLGSLEHTRRILYMHDHVACARDFDGISPLADRASQVFVATLGTEGRRTRSVLGVSRLPQNVPVMIDLRVAVEHTSERVPAQARGTRE